MAPGSRQTLSLRVGKYKPFKPGRCQARACAWVSFLAGEGERGRLSLIRTLGLVPLRDTMSGIGRRRRTEDSARAISTKSFPKSPGPFSCYVEQLPLPHTPRMLAQCVVPRQRKRHRRRWHLTCPVELAHETSAFSGPPGSGGNAHDEGTRKDRPGEIVGLL